MTADEARVLVSSVLTGVAPEVEVGELDPHVSLRMSAELDSMDFLSYVAALSDGIDHDIPESDYDQVDSINAAVEYLVSHTG